jgi:hypothetical protein
MSLRAYEPPGCHSREESTSDLDVWKSASYVYCELLPFLLSLLMSPRVYGCSGCEECTSALDVWKSASFVYCELLLFLLSPWVSPRVYKHSGCREEFTSALDDTKSVQVVWVLQRVYTSDQDVAKSVRGSKAV